MKKRTLPLFLLSLIGLPDFATAQTTTTYSVLSTAYNRSSGSFFPLGSVDNGWFLTEIQDMVVPLDPTTLVVYPNNPTYVVSNDGNNSFPGIIADHSINHANTTNSTGSKLITYRTYFTLPNPAISGYGYSLHFRMSADDAVDHVSFNGVKRGQYLDANFNNIPGVDKPYILTIPTCDPDFRPGQNVIDVTMADAGGNIGFYAEIELRRTVTVCEGVGINEHHTTPQAFSIAPNPAGERLILSHSKDVITNSPVHISVYGVDGRLSIAETIVPESVEHYSIDTGKLPPGMYFLNLRSDGRSENFKFIKE